MILIEIFYFIVFVLSLLFLFIVSFFSDINTNEAIRNIILAFLGLNFLEKMFNIEIKTIKKTFVFKRKLIIFILFFIYNVLIFIFKKEMFDIVNFYIVISAILLVKGTNYINKRRDNENTERSIR